MCYSALQTGELGKGIAWYNIREIAETAESICAKKAPVKCLFRVRKIEN